MRARPWKLWAVLPSLALVCAGLTACDDEAAKTQKEAEDTRSVAEGAKARTAAGAKVEDAKEQVEAAEKALETRDDDIFEKSGGERVGRGVP